MEPTMYEIKIKNLLNLIVDNVNACTYASTASRCDRCRRGIEEINRGIHSFSQAEMADFREGKR